MKYVRKTYYSFEGARGILALLVCVGHLGLNTITEELGIHIRFELSVDIFFAISGFVLAQAYYFSGRKFSTLLTGRIARLLPLHIFTLLWVLLIDVSQGIYPELNLLVQNLLLIHNIGLPPNKWILNFPSWSISVELVVSLLMFPVSYLSYKKRTYLPLLCVILLCFVTPLGAGYAYRNDATYFNNGVIRGIVGFFIGVSAYNATIRLPNACPVGRFLVVPSLIGLSVMIMTPTWSSFHSIMFCLLTYIILIGLSTGAMDCIFGRKPFVWLGKISYSIYLTHIPILYSAQLALDPLWLAGWSKFLLLAIIIIVSDLTFRWIELPCKDLINNSLSRSGR